MRWGKIIEVTGDKVIVEVGRQRQKPMRIPKGAFAEAGDRALIDDSTGVHLVISVYSQE